MNLNSLPPIIQQKIESLKDPSETEHTKFNIAANLENVVECCNKAISDYRNKR